MMTVEDVARVCYEANRAYCRTHGRPGLAQAPPVSPATNPPEQ